MSRTQTPTPLPELEQQLLIAARRLDAAEAPARRRWWRHGWSLLTLVALAGGASVAVARVAEVGPFAYMSGGILNENPKLAPRSTITLQPAGPEPAWQARAYVDGLNRLCITGGPRDPRTTPNGRPTNRHPNNPPQNGNTCTDSDGVAEVLVDASRPGATFAMWSELDGSLQGRTCRVQKKTGRCVPIKVDPATRLLVFGVRAAGAPRPVVRWYADGGLGAPIAMRASEHQLRMSVDHSPDGLSAAEQKIVAGYPDHLDLVLWAAAVRIPRGARFPQLAFPSEMPVGAVDDATIAMTGMDDFTSLIERAKKSGWKPTRGVSRDEPPARVINAAQRKWIAAFDRLRVASDEVPQRLHTEIASLQRFGYGLSRKLTVVGGGLGDVWIAPGAMTEDTASSADPDQICFVGASVLMQCKFGQRLWKRPFAEAVSCTQGAGWPKPLPGGRTLVWALAPPGVTGVELRGPGKRVETLPAGELLAVRRPASQRVAWIVWNTDAGKSIRVRVPWPKAGPRCERGAVGGQVVRKDNASSSEISTWRPHGTH
jgi:hypothetical protein